MRVRPVWNSAINARVQKFTKFSASSIAIVVVVMKLPFSFSNSMVNCPVNWQLSVPASVRERDDSRVELSYRSISVLCIVLILNPVPADDGHPPQSRANPHCNCRRSHRHRHLYPVSLCASHCCLNYCCVVHYCVQRNNNETKQCTDHGQS